jgi:hypothetical protein
VKNRLEGDIFRAKPLAVCWMVKTRSPSGLLEHCMVLATIVISRLARTLEDDVPETIMIEYTADISFNTEISWYDWVL